MVSEFELIQTGGGGGFTYQGIKLGMKASNAHVAVDIRMIDSSSGQILYSHNAVGRAESSGLTFGMQTGDVDFDAAGFQKTPIGQATRKAIHNAITFIINKMENIPFTARVLKAAGNKVYINVGSLMRIKPGDRFSAFSKGEEFIDPDTGLSLGSEETYLGTVEIGDVKDKYSTGHLVSGAGTLKRGDILKGGLNITSFDVPAAAQRYFNLGKERFNKEDYRGAEEAHRQAVTQVPSFALGYNELAVSLSRQGRHEESVPFYRKAVELKGDATLFHKNLAFALEQTGRHKEAQAEYDKALRLNPDDSDAREKVHLLDGEALLSQGDYRGAEEALRQAVKELPDSTQAKSRLGDALLLQVISHEEKGDTSAAQRSYKEALTVIPKESATLFRLDGLRAQKISRDLKQSKRARLGVFIMAFGPEEIQVFRARNVGGLPKDDIRGLLVTDIMAGSAAATAGIKPALRKEGAKDNKPESFTALGDIIMEIDGKPALGNLLSHLAKKQPSDTISLLVIRAGKSESVSVTLTEMK